MLRILDFAKKSCPKMAGGCPAFGSGSYGRNVATVTQVPRKVIAKRSKEEEELIARRFRDVSSACVLLSE
jgi:hypothetical protein